MEFLTTTHLRTQSPKLVQLLKRGTTVSLVHRSQVIGLIEPQLADEHVVNDMKQFKKTLLQLAPVKKLTSQQRQDKYSSHLAKKYG